MALRTPRRRISPQTKRRCKAIKGFFRRALGTASQTDFIQIASSIAVNVNNINQKISGLEQQLTEASKLCRATNSHESIPVQSKSPVPSETRRGKSQQDIPSGMQPGREETNILISYPSESQSIKTDKSDNTFRANYESSKAESLKKINVLSTEQYTKKKRTKNVIKVHENDVGPTYDKCKPLSKSTHQSIVSAYTTTSFHSVEQLREKLHSKAEHPIYCEEKRNRPRVQNDLQREKKIRDHLKKFAPESYEPNHEERIEKNPKKRKSKRYSEGVDQDFIADIIRRQYKPVKMFDKQRSDLSLFSAPVCRDCDLPRSTELPGSEDPQRFAGEGEERHRHDHHSDCSDIRNVCNARLYNVQRSTRKKHSRKHNVDIYNDSNIYDLVPVKEKTSPKSRRKFFEDHNNISHACYKEVPPSPRSHRPRLNLKAQYSESDFNMNFARDPDITGSPRSLRRQVTENICYEKEYPSDDCETIISPQRGKYKCEEIQANYCFEIPKIGKNNISYRHECEEDKPRDAGTITSKHRDNPNKIFLPNDKTLPSDDIEENMNLAEIQKTGGDILNNREADTQRDIGTVKSAHRVFETEEYAATIETPLNKTQDTVFSDKTDKALCEIKDILQNFLLEIKKEASSHSCKLEVNTKVAEKCNGPLNDVKIIGNEPKFKNYNSVPPFPVIPPPYIAPLPNFGNTCCYPVLPVCRMNCMQNSCAVTSTSYTCNNCAEKSNETDSSKDTARNGETNVTVQSGTDELIKEIYKFVSRSPVLCRKVPDSIIEESNARTILTDAKVLTSRSAGEAVGVSKHDAKVGTPQMNCVSKSCEAIDSKISSEVYTNENNTSYSESYSENLSLEPTGTPSTLETELTTELYVAKKNNKSKLAKVMRSLGLFKKNKKDVIEELSESDSTIDDKVKKKPPFMQDVNAYAMYGQEFYRPPPAPSPFHPEYPQDYRPPYDPDVFCRDPRMRQPVGLAPPQPQYLPEKRSPVPPYREPYQQYRTEPRPNASPYCDPYPQYHPQTRPPPSPYCEPYELYNQMQPQVPFCLKEVEVKSIGCQSERKLSFFKKITKKTQPSEEIIPDKVPIPRNDSKPMREVQNKSKLFDWKSPQAKLRERQMSSSAYMDTQRKLIEKDQKLKNAMVKRFFPKMNPFSPNNQLLKSLLAQDKLQPPTLRGRSFF